MKNFKLQFLLILSLATTVAYSQLSAVDYTSENFVRFKASKTYFVKTGNVEFDNEMQTALTESWKITPIDVIESKDFDKKLPDASASFLVYIKIESTGPSQVYHYLSVINGGKKNLNKYSYESLLAYAPINFYAGEASVEKSAFRARNIVESMVKAMDLVQKNDIKGSSKKIVDKLRDIYNEKASTIKSRTLLVNQDQIYVQFMGKKGKSISKEDFGKIYPGKFEFVSQARIAEVIKQKSSEYFYLQLTATLNKSIFVFDPSNGEVVYFNYKIQGMDIKDDDVEDLRDAINGKK